MKTYHLTRTQFLPISIEKAWDFFSSPKNLEKITPSSMKFKIRYTSGGQQAYAGQIINYKLIAPPGFPVTWLTEITQVQKPNLFIDEQRFGPFAFWHHQHHFKEVVGGIEMTDELSYAVPFGIIGQLANWIFVEREVNAIFDYRYKVLDELFKLQT